MISTSRPESRRDVLALFAASPVAFAATPALAFALPTRLPQSAPDAMFWAAYAHLAAIEAARDEDLGDEPDIERANYWYAIYRTAQISMLTHPVQTAAAILAKWRHCAGDEVFLPAPFNSSMHVIAADLERLASREARA